MLETTVLDPCDLINQILAGLGYLVLTIDDFLYVSSSDNRIYTYTAQIIDARQIADICTACIQATMAGSETHSLLYVSINRSPKNEFYGISSHDAKLHIEQTLFCC